MAEYTGRYYSEDIVYKETSSFDSGNQNSGTVLYEVLRIFDGTALFLEDHIERLQESVRLSGFAYSVSVPVIHYLIRNLIRKNDMFNGNIKIVINFRVKESPVIYTYFIPHAYPDPLMYKEGVESDFFTAERENPNVKKLHTDFRQRVTAFISTENLYDALLVSENETITEGSKTNIFFIKENSVFTPPGDMVLKGITRGKAIGLCKNLHIPLVEQSIAVKNIGNFEAAFFTGTSPKILPVKRIANSLYDVNHPLMRTLMRAYDDLIAASINSL